MSDTQNAIFAQAYSRNIMQLAQQKYSKLLPFVFIKPTVQGKNFFQDQIGAWSMEQKGGRNVQTPNNDPALDRRMGTLVDFHDARLLDRGDEIRTISDPRSAYTIAAASSLGRKMDDVILQAALGTAYYGETGSSSVTHSNVVATTTGYLYLSHLTAIKKAFDDADIEEEDRVMVITPTALSNMLQVSSFTSSDYAAVKALVKGEIDTFMGFTWRQSTRIAQLTTTNTPYSASISAIAFQKFGICMAMGAQPLVRTDERTDLSYSWQIYYELNIGAVRLEEKRVVSCNAI